MKKKIKAELVSIAHRVLQLKDDSNLNQLQEEARQLYEKLTLLHFAEQHFYGPQPTIGQVRSFLENEDADTLQEIPQEIPKEKQKPITLEIIKNSDRKKKTQELDKKTPPREITPKEKSKPDKPEFIIDKVNADISEDLFVPATAEEINAILRSENTPKGHGGIQKNDMENVTPILEEHKSKSLNEQLKKNITIGLNDRLAFIKHLFNGSSADYNRVLSQLNTLGTQQEAAKFINNMVKPDYNNWEGKEEYEQRFLEVVGNRFD